MDLPLLEQALAERGEPAFRARQVWEWTARGAAGYDAMTNLPRALRDELAAAVPFSTLTVETEREAKDGTVKTLFRTADGHPVEAVLMRYRDGRRSLCLSSQSGCPLTCTFCATGSMAFGRNLTASEILDQALHFRRSTELDHAVFMGMGEPMLNLDEVLGAARRLPDLGITHRRTTISTVGWLPGLKRFVDEVNAPIRLALSLHAPDDELRSRIMPVNDRYPIAEIVAECVRQREATRRRVFVEYVMLAGAGARPRRTPRPRPLQGQPHPVQPDGVVRRLVARAHCGVPLGAREGARAGHRPPDARAGHRGGVRPARRGAARYTPLGDSVCCAAGSASSCGCFSKPYLTTGRFAARTSSSLRTGR
jgi:23S rRNA (adenine2503-C2)-methyltransferase